MSFPQVFDNERVIPADFRAQKAPFDFAALAQGLSDAVRGTPPRLPDERLTAALATSTPKRGEHGVFVAAQSARGVVTYGLTLAKGLRGRVGEDRVAGALFVHALAEACGVRAPLGVVRLLSWAGEAATAVRATPSSS